MVQQNQISKMQKMLLLTIITIFLLYFLSLVGENRKNILDKINKILWKKESFQNCRSSNRCQKITILESTLVDPDTIDPNTSINNSP